MEGLLIVAFEGESQEMGWSITLCWDGRVYIWIEVYTAGKSNQQRTHGLQIGKRVGTCVVCVVY